MEELVALDARPLDRQDAEVAVLDRRSGRDAGNRSGTEVVRVEPVVRHQDDRHVVADISQEHPQHLVVELIGDRDDVLIEVEVLLLDLFLLRRMITHEPMTEVVNRVVIDGEEIPRLILDQPGRGRVDADAFGDG